MSRTGRPAFWDKYAAEMVSLYEEQKLSRAEIARRLGTTVPTVTRVLTREGITMEARNPNAGRSPEEQQKINEKIAESRKGKGTGSRVERVEITCDHCEQPFTYVPGRTGTRFCSRQCRARGMPNPNKEAALERYAVDPSRCPCGEAIPYEYRHDRKYCSDGCLEAYGLKRQPDPANSVTFSCETCGTEVTRYRSYGGGNHRFCSNACASRSYNRRVHVEDLVLDSGWEALFWGLCKYLKIPVERMDRARAVSDGKITYAPDFDIKGVAIEVKGLEDDDDRARCSLWRQERGPLVVMGRDEIDQMRKVGDKAEAQILLARLVAEQNRSLR